MSGQSEISVVDERALRVARNMGWQLLKLRYDESEQSSAVFAVDKIIGAYVEATMPVPSAEEGLREDLEQFIQVCLTNPNGTLGFIAANYPKQYAAQLEKNKGTTLDSEQPVEYVQLRKDIYHDCWDFIRTTDYVGSLEDRCNKLTDRILLYMDGHNALKRESGGLRGACNHRECQFLPICLHKNTSIEGQS